MPIGSYQTTITVGDTRKPISGIFYENDGDIATPIELTGLDVEFKMETSAGASKIAQTASNVTIQPTVEFTANATTDKIKVVGHNLRKGYMLQLSTTSALPAGLTTTERYFVIDVEPDYFKLSASPNGSKVDITDAGTGTHSFYIVGHARYQWQSADVDTAGQYRAWFIVLDGANDEHFPTIDAASDGQGDGIRIDFVSA